MSITRITYFTADPADLETLLVRRGALIDAVRAAYPGLAEARLSMLDDERPEVELSEDQRWVDVWQWDSASSLQAAVEGAPALPEAAAAFSLVRDVISQQGKVIDER